MRSLTEAEIQQFLAEYPDWQASDGKLQSIFKLPSFREATALLQLIFLQAESQDHHPELKNIYNAVEIALTTHDAGSQITDKDTEMASYISKHAAKLK